MVAIWRLWTRRCCNVFERDEVDLAARSLTENVMHTAKDLHMAEATKEPVSRPVRQIRWEAPPWGVVKVRTGQGNPGMAGAGGLIRGSAGEWFCGFQAHLGTCTNTAAELYAVRLGLGLAWQEGFRNVVCEVDAQMVVTLVYQTEVDLHPVFTLGDYLAETGLVV